MDGITGQEGAMADQRTNDHVDDSGLIAGAALLILMVFIVIAVATVFIH
jgi:hypothetical protein